MLKSIAKFFFQTAVGRMLTAEVLELFKAFILKWFAEKHNHAHELPIITKLEEGLQQISVDDFLRVKDDAEFRFLSSRLKTGGTLIAGTREGKIVLKNLA